MDTLRGHDVANDQDDFDYADDAAIDAPLMVVSDERRMQVRAYNYWASLLGDRTLPSIEDLSPDQLEDFGPHSVLLDFSTGLDNPAIVYLGTALRQECEIDGSIGYINDVPARSLLSRLTDHYLQIVANAAPIGFEAEFVNQRDAEILYRGILMPFSSDDETIDFVFGVINWKELASRDVTDALELEVGAALLNAMPARTDVPIWADGPTGDEEVAPLPQSKAVASFDEEPLDLSGMESPTEDAPLADWLALARDGADQVRTSEARSHAALYRAIGLAYDFALVAQARPDDYAELLADCGIKVQARSPMTAIIKLVFGAAYDKTRITEYATALDHGWAVGLGVGTLADYLSSYAGGLKALVRDERAQRRAEAPPRPDKRQSARSAMKAAAAIDPQALATDADGLAIVVARREADGTLALVAALPEGSDLAQRVILAAAR
ncbi:hypothetical protein D0Z70_19265 [Sphingobium terrigena]|uniref:PAS domain-containing protein n=1 Tax=Sphingobium terrigena TaxID=2304063 RepID=A0A418YN17_9SPHN|nr:hypothetical protein [Sphingobium terrigena]RJG52587.1 hypothetical protein D0Z70_19265 [Sphingobium terrigena]